MKKAIARLAAHFAVRRADKSFCGTVGDWEKMEHKIRGEILAKYGFREVEVSGEYSVVDAYGYDGSVELSHHEHYRYWVIEPIEKEGGSTI